ncbi:MAG: sugar ABC transporter permease [Candidatus Thioglobus sp.]|nr:sugar ABC transporter permease [Candidatus Thioglobus sp.]|tara:strand:+ start:198 stop:1499 length:1302 start_codon:yes stop_codon:yes gene_type:complete
MIYKAQLERLFVSSVMLAFASLALSIVGIKSQLFQTIQFLFLFIALISLVVLGVQSKTIQFNANRLKKQIIGWLLSSVFSIAIWLFAQKDFQSIFPALKGYKKALNTLEPFAIYAAIVFILFALILSIVGARDSRLDRPGFIERTLVYNLSSKIAALPMMFTSIGIFVIATLWTVYHSFTNSRMLPKSEFVGLAQYERLWSSDRWYMSIENLAIYGACSLIFSLFIGFILAALLDQKTRFENTFRTIFLYPFALSFIVTGLVWQWILNPEYGVEKIIRSIGFESFVFNPLYNTDIVIYGILAAGLWQGTGFIMCLMLAGLRGIDQEIWKAAKIDGIPMWKTYIQIVIPMMRPIFITTLVIIAAGIIKVYDLVVAQTSGGPGISSEVPAKYVYDYMFSAQNLGQGFAASTMMLVSVLIVLIPFAYLQFGRRKHD